MPWARHPALDATVEESRRSERAWNQNRAFSFALIDRSSGVVLGVAGLDCEEPNVAELR